MADELCDLRHGTTFDAVCSKRAVGRFGDLGGSVDEGAVQVEADDVVDQGGLAPLQGAERALASLDHSPDERCEDQLHRQFHLAAGHDDRVGA